MRRIVLDAMLILLVAGNVFGYVSPTVKHAGGYINIADVTVDDNKLDVNSKSWYDVGTSGVFTGWIAIPSQFSGYCQIEIYAKGDGNDPNNGQADVNCFTEQWQGGAKRVFGSTVLVGDVQLSHDPYTGTTFRTSAIPDPNHKWADSDSNFIESWETDVGRSGNLGTETRDNILRYSFRTGQARFVRMEFTNLSGHISEIVAVMTGGKNSED